MLNKTQGRSAPTDRPFPQRAFRYILISIDEQKNGARDGTRTRDNHVGNVELYQLSYSRSKLENYSLWEEKI